MVCRRAVVRRSRSIMCLRSSHDSTSGRRSIEGRPRTTAVTLLGLPESWMSTKVDDCATPFKQPFVDGHSSTPQPPRSPPFARWVPNVLRVQVVIIGFSGDVEESRRHCADLAHVWRSPSVRVPLAVRVRRETYCESFKASISFFPLGTVTAEQAQHSASICHQTTSMQRPIDELHFVVRVLTRQFRPSTVGMVGRLPIGLSRTNSIKRHDFMPKMHT